MVTIPRPASGLGSTTAAVDNVIDVRNLHVEFHTSLGTVRAVNGVSLGVPRGKTLVSSVRVDAEKASPPSRSCSLSPLLE